jgi:hypothetical protein
MARAKKADEERRAANWARQQRYRERHIVVKGGPMPDASPVVRLNALIDTDAKDGLERLTVCYGVTQKSIIERFVAEAETALIDPLDADTRADYRAGGYRAPMPECLFRSTGLSGNADEIEALRSNVDELTRALGIKQTHLEARQAVIDELARQLETLRAAAAVETVSAKGEVDAQSDQGQADDKAKKGGPWPVHVWAMAVRMAAEGADMKPIAEAMSAAAGGRVPPSTSSLPGQIRTWATKLGV